MSEVHNLIHVLHRAHLDNSQLFYYAQRKGDGHRISQMPITSFVYEFFIYNSIYQVDWKSSYDSQQLEYWNWREKKEGPQQDELEHFLIDRIKKKPALVYRAFLPLKRIALSGTWTRIVEDKRIKRQHGETFFKSLSEIQEALLNTMSKDINVDEFFKCVKKCREFIYKVRNNIFHGSKTLGEIGEGNQKRRIDVYNFFLKSLNSLFFLAAMPSENIRVASDVLVEGEENVRLDRGLQ